MVRKTANGVTENSGYMERKSLNGHERRRGGLASERRQTFYMASSVLDGSASNMPTCVRRDEACVCGYVDVDVNVCCLWWW